MTKFYLIIPFIMVLVACEGNLNFAIRSGDMNDDYIEEPIPDIALKYEQALQTSNKILGLMKSNDLSSIYENHIDELFKTRASIKQFNNMLAQIESGNGKIINFKKMQWGFWPRTEDGKDILVSSKIVEYDKGIFKFYFFFKNDGSYTKIIGFRIVQRTGVAPAGQL